MATASEASQQANRSAMDPKRLVVIFLLLAGIVTGLFLEHVLGLIWARFTWNDPVLIEGVDWRVSTLVGYLLAVGLAAFIWFNPKTHALGIEVAIFRASNRNKRRGIHNLAVFHGRVRDLDDLAAGRETSDEQQQQADLFGGPRAAE